MLGYVMDDVVEPAAEDFQLPRILDALADPNRLAAVRFVARNGESWCTQVMEEAVLPMTKSTFSHHLRILREAGVVTKRIQGARGYTSLRKDDLDSRFPGLIDSIVNVAQLVTSDDVTRAQAQRKASTVYTANDSSPLASVAVSSGERSKASKPAHQ